jgi:hypothetical protein
MGSHGRPQAWTAPHCFRGLGNSDEDEGVGIGETLATGLAKGTDNDKKKGIILLELFLFYYIIKSHVLSSIAIKRNQPKQKFRHSSLIK